MLIERKFPSIGSGYLIQERRDSEEDWIEFWLCAKSTLIQSSGCFCRTDIMKNELKFFDNITEAWIEYQDRIEKYG